MTTSPALVVLSCLLVQGCVNSDDKVIAKAEPAPPPPAASKGDSFIQRGETIVPRRDSAGARGPRTAEGGSPSHSFSDRFAPAGFAVQATLEQSARAAAADRTGTIPSSSSTASSSYHPSGSYKTAALSPQLSYAALPAVKQAHTRLIGFENSAFPYSSKGGKYSDNRVLIHVPAGFDVTKPAVIVVFFHGHRATLERDVRDRQLLPAQISESGVNAVLVAPQLAYDAADSSAGKFAERDGMKRFLAEAADHLTRLYGDPRAKQAFTNMPVVIVAYSGGFLSAAASLQVGGLGKRVSGVVLLDALYGELDKFTSWIVKNRTAFFVTAYTTHNKARDDNLAKMLRERDIPFQYGLKGALEPGTVAFLSLGDSAGHRDFVTRAWTKLPVTDILERMAER